MAKIEFFEAVFDPRFCRFLLEDSRKQLYSGAEFGRSNFHWDKGIVRASHPVLVRDYGAELSAMIIAQLRKRGVVSDGEFSVMNYAWTRLSYIPWHTDRPHRAAATIYLNEKWKPDWGGLFLYMDGSPNEIRGYMPQFNCGLRNNANLPHSTTPVGLDADEPRFTLQLFSRAIDVEAAAEVRGG